MKFTKDEIKKLEQFILKLQEFKEKIDKVDYIHNKEKFFDIMKEFRKYLLEHDDGNIYTIFYHSKYYDFYKNYFTRINEYYLRSLESIQSLSVITKWIHGVKTFSNLIDKELIRESFLRKEKELQPIDFSNAKKLVLVWSWPFPETLLYIYENTSVEKIVWIDYNHEAIFIAGEMIWWLNIDNITIEQFDGTEYDYSDADIVILPIFVSPKEKIIERIIKTWKDNVQILISNPKWLWKLLYEWLEEIHPQANIVYKEDFFSSFLAQEIIKLEKYNF